MRIRWFASHQARSSRSFVPSAGAASSPIWMASRDRPCASAARISDLCSPPRRCSSMRYVSGMVGLQAYPFKSAKKFGFGGARRSGRRLVIKSLAIVCKVSINLWLIVQVKGNGSMNRGEPNRGEFQRDAFGQLAGVEFLENVVEVDAMASDADFAIDLLQEIGQRDTEHIRHKSGSVKRLPDYIIGVRVRGAKRDLEGPFME